MDSTPESSLFQCGSCKRAYKRMEHLSRHVRSHTQSRPYQCRLCPKSFTRIDLLKRHAASHDEAGGWASTSDQPQKTKSGSLASRVTQACRPCASQHLRCSEQKPCHRCTARSVTCVWDQPADVALEGSSPVAAIQTSEQPEGDSVLEQGDDEERLSVVPVSNHYAAASIGPMDSCMPQGAPPALHSDELNSDPGPSPSQAADTPFGMSLEHPYFSLFTDKYPMPGQGPSAGVLNMGLPLNFELNDIDLRFLGLYNNNIPFEFGTQPQQSPNTGQPLGDPCDPGGTVAICTEAFRNSHLIFRPNTKDHSAAEEHNLSLPADMSNHASPESRIQLDRRVLSGRLTVATRDRILALVVETCRSENLAKAVVSFPSVELLDTLLQYYLTSPVVNAESFIHAASFNPNRKRPELIAAMAAHGAILTSDAPLVKLGFAIQECVRTSVPKHWERDNSLVRDLELAQAWLITLEAGLWSGHSRKVEIAECFLQPMLTMVRRDGRFRRSAYPRTSVPDDTSGDSLHLAWEQWIHHESFKRFAFRILQHDTNCSASLLVNPLLSYAEVLLPFPDGADLWATGSPEHWKTLLLSGQPNSTSKNPLALPDYLDDPDRFQSQMSTVDAAFVHMSFLACAWAVSWEYIQLLSLRDNQSKRFSGLLMASRYEELLRFLNYFRIVSDPRLPGAVESTMRLELITLHLHVPFERLQTFAGVEGADQARAVHPKICEWVKSEEARKAVWHAGQIIRSARLLSKTMLQGPSAVMVYHASLSLWVYGLLIDGPRPSGGWVGEPDGIPGRGGAVKLDGEEGIALQRFIQLGIGSPCIRSSPELDAQFSEGVTVYLSEPGSVMEAVICILRTNHDGTGMPHLVSKLIQLMRGLKKAASNRSLRGSSYG